MDGLFNERAGSQRRRVFDVNIRDDLDLLRSQTAAVA